MLHDGGVHLCGGDDRDEGAAGGGRERSGRGDEDDLRAALAGGFGEGVAHLAGGAVAEEADGVECLARAAGGDEDGLGGEVLDVAGRGCGEDGFDDGVEICEAAGAGHAAGEIAGVGIYEVHTAAAQEGDVGLGGRVIPHVDVHGGGDDDRSFGGEEQGGEEVVGEAVGHLREDVGGGGGDDDDVGELGLGDVLDLACGIEAGGGRLRCGFLVRGFGPEAGDDLVAGEGGEGERADELLGGASHDDVDVGSALLEEADQLGGLVGGDSPGDAYRNAEGFHGSYYRRRAVGEAMVVA